MYFGGNHWATILMPMTKPAPTELSTSLAMSSCKKELPKAKTMVGTVMITMRPENTTRAPYRSIRAPTTMRAGMVSATLAMSRILTCSSVSQPTLSSIVVDSGAMLNHT